VKIGALEIAKPSLLWINDGLMAVFFFLVGLEIKREALEGQLSSVNQIAPPGVAAIGGMAVPAAIYAYFNWSNPVDINGWAIPAATDIAFALGILMLLGSRVPLAIKVFLTAVAIIDDLGAIVIIALFYTENLSLTSLAWAIGGLVICAIMNLRGVTRVAPYILIGVIVWVAVLKSGVHATLAGVLLALAVPLRATDAEGHSPLRILEHILHPWVAFLVLPLFAFANAGVNFFRHVVLITSGATAAWHRARAFCRQTDRCIRCSLPHDQDQTGINARRGELVHAVRCLSALRDRLHNESVCRWARIR
jgi:NhaA family Na+:H+ antiporter